MKTGSDWVSYADSGSGSAVPANGFYEYTSTLNVSDAGTYDGTIGVLADDTLAVWINGTLIVKDARTLIPAVAGHRASRPGIRFVPEEQGERPGSELVISLDVLFGGRSGLNFPLSPEIPQRGGEG
jgi:hypothetical protein